MELVLTIIAGLVLGALVIEGAERIEERANR